VTNCKFNAINYEDDYENIDGKTVLKKQPAPQIQPAMNHQKRYERNFSPPRSSNSSGYGTGSSSRSFTAANDQRFVPDMGTLTSSSSGHSSNDERWYDIVEQPQQQTDPKNGQVESNAHHQKLGTANSLPLTQNHSFTIHEGRPLLRPMSDYVSPESLMKNLHINEDKNNKNNNNNNRPEPIYSVSMKNMNHQQTSLDKNDLNRINTTAEITQLKRSATTNNIQTTKKAPTATVAPTSSSSSSRNNSPRPIAEAKLRPGVTSRTANSNHRASVHYSSTLQEDLLKLINPDYLMGSSDDNFHLGGITNAMKPKHSPNSHSLGNISTNFQTSPLKAAIISDDLVLAKKKSRSREGINLGNGLTNGGNLKFHKSNGTSPDEEIIITTAKTATVISSSSSSPASELIQNSKLLHISEEKLKMSPRKQTNGNMSGGMIKNKFLADMKESDWDTLMDTATRAMIQVRFHYISFLNLTHF
jgi:signal-induced proliferation-associated 1 like protein 1